MVEDPDILCRRYRAHRHQMWCRLKSIEARERAHRRQMWCRLKIKEARERVYSRIQSCLIHAIRGASYSRGFLTKATKVTVSSFFKADESFKVDKWPFL